MKRALLIVALLMVCAAWFAVIILRGQSYSGTNTDAIKLFPSGVISFPYGMSAAGITNSSMSSQPLAVDGNGKVVPIVMGSGMVWDGSLLSISVGGTSPYYRAGKTNVANLSTSQAIVFSSPLASTNYTPVVSSLFALGAISFSYSLITTNGFTINLSAGAVGGGQVNYAAILAN